MIIGTSAILTILGDEPERRQFTEALEGADECLMSTASFVEASLVLEATRGYEGLRDLMPISKVHTTLSVEPACMRRAPDETIVTHHGDG